MGSALRIRHAQVRDFVCLHFTFRGSPPRKHLQRSIKQCVEGVALPLVKMVLEVVLTGRDGIRARGKDLSRLFCDEIH